MNKRTVLTASLLVLLVVTRVNIRSRSPLWTDEIEQVRNLRTVEYLIFEYLPKIPGGWPGHYLLTLSIQNLYPYNKFLLGLPGLLAHVGVFIFVPNVLKSMFTIDHRRLAVSAFAARLLFTLDPYLTFQSMEVRPYALLPFVWILCVILSVSFVKEKWKDLKSMTKVIRLFIFITFYLLLFIWHAYSFIMTISIMIFLIIQLGLLKKHINFAETALVIFSAGILSFPVLRYFAQGASRYALNPFAMVPSVSEVISGQRGIMIVFAWQQLVFLLTMALIVCTVIYTVRRLRSNVDKRVLFRQLVFPFSVLVLLPVIIIVILDIINPYWILYRQFAWTTVPFYLVIVSVAGNVLTRDNRGEIKIHAQKNH